MESAPDSEQVQDSASFSELKMSNAKRYEVLTEILTSLGLSCELNQVPEPSPIYLLSTQLVSFTLNTTKQCFVYIYTGHKNVVHQLLLYTQG